jgi:predicted permease
MLIRGWRRLRFRTRRRQSYSDLAEELESHRQFAAADHRKSGAAPSSAETFSRHQMGNMFGAMEECHDMWSFPKLESLLQDIRYASRIFRRTPGFTSIAVLSLALGIGGNTAMFSLVHSLLIRPLPYTEPDRLFRITGIYPRAALPFFEARNRTIEVGAATPEFEFNLTGYGEAMRVSGSVASVNLFALLGAPVSRGRAFAPGEASPGREAVVILGDALWRAKFGADPDVLGKVVSLNGVNREIVGVMPPGFAYPSSRAQLWIPMRIDPSNFLEFWAGSFLPLVARLKPDVVPQQARAEVHSLSRQFLETFPYPMARDFNRDSTIIPLQQDLVGGIRGKLVVLLASVGAVLLIACANVASLLLSRAAARRKEIALRTALGAGRRRVVRQLLTESVLLAFAGGALGVLLGGSALSIFKSVLPPSTPGLAAASVDWQVAAGIAALALFTGLAFGIAPALGASQVDLASDKRSGSQRSTSAAWTRARTWLIGAEVALTVVLVVSAGLLLRSLYTLSETSLGFEPSRLLTVHIAPNQSFCARREACVALYDRLLARARQIPGVAEASVVSSVPLDGAQQTLAVDVEGYPKTAENPAPLFWAGAIDPAYIGMMRIPLLAGRGLAESDSMAAAPAILISAATAKRFWPGQSPIGKHIKTAGESKWRTIVGVVADVRQFDLGQGFPNFVGGAFYMPYAQSARTDGQIPASMTLIVKARLGAPRLGEQIQALAKDQDPNIPVSRVLALDDIVAGSISDFRSTIRVFLAFGAAAILLAAIGVYGLVSYWVGQRTFEIGVRLAMGASRPRILSMVFTQGLRVALCGTALGIAIALIATRFLAGLLFGVAPTDAATFVTVTALVLIVAAAATLFPAWRASRLDPTRAFQVE